MKTFAPAKINLYLHLTGKRADGYHTLDSLVAFVGVGDWLELVPAPSFSLEIQGPMAGALAGDAPADNLISRAVSLLAAEVGQTPDFRMILTKNLPVASGIGGGSTDAAAALRLAATHWGISDRDPRLFTIAAKLGQDIPCCIDRETCLFRDIGNVTDPGPALPTTHIVMVNPMKGLSTPSVYKAREGAFQPENRLVTAPETTENLVAALNERTNGLAEAAYRLMPEIETILSALRAEVACLLARMTGSGATCFGIFADRASARQAAATLHEAHPEWWVVATLFPAASGESLGTEAK